VTEGAARETGRPSYVVGVDLGQTHDPTAIVVAEVVGRGKEARFDLRHLERILQKPYTFVAERVKVLSDRLAKAGEVIVGFDQTGVGRAVADILRGAELGVPLYGISITAGDAVTCEGSEYHVPKRDLVAVLQVALQNDRVRIAKGLPLAELLVRELLNFRVKVTAGANETFEAWRAGDHDDFVLATAIAVWLAERTFSIFDFEKYCRLELLDAETPTPPKNESRLVIVCPRVIPDRWDS
jgi:phage FluMu gp28-like protein